ncbi:MAG: hypothetical protein JWQ28_2581 [Pedobacter sp.]|jgi:hypothetical protein|nr:hypothetical protein [Pedobacter sp.]
MPYSWDASRKLDTFEEHCMCRAFLWKSIGVLGYECFMVLGFKSLKIQELKKQKRYEFRNYGRTGIS